MAQIMSSTEVVSQVLVKADASETQNSTFASIKDYPDIPLKTRLAWCQKMIKSATASESTDTICRLDFIFKPDGSIERITGSPSEYKTNAVYPARNRIPLSTLVGINREEQVRRAESFALGSLFYEILIGHKPYEDICDKDVQAKYCKGDFPTDVLPPEVLPLLYSYWSWEFRAELNKIRKLTLQSPLDML